MTLPNSSHAAKGRVKTVLVADDSGAVLGMMVRLLKEDSYLNVVAKARNGKQAVEMYKEHKPDFAILDVQMPVMSGIEALVEIRKFDSMAKVFICSAVTKKDAAEVLNAVTTQGAVDFIKKPSGSAEVVEFISGLCDRMHQIGARPKLNNLSSSSRNLASSRSSLEGAGEEIIKRPYPALSILPKILAIGSSTGGPKAIMEVLKPLKGKLSVPVVITQHMPATFTPMFAKQIADETGIEAKEAEDGDIIRNGVIYIAPGDYHMRFKRLVSKEVKVVLGQDEKVNFCRPAVDPMFESIFDIYKNNILSVILTGMGSDGCNGARKIVEGGQNILISQDKETSAVWGMPAAVASAGLCHEVLPLSQISNKLLTILGR